MKLLPFLLLALLFIAPTFAQTPDKTPPIEYNIAVCGGPGMGIIHLLLATDKDNKETLIFDSIASGPGVIEKDKDPIIFTTTKKGKVPDEESITTRESETTFKGVVVSLMSAYKDNRISGLIVANDQIIQYVYGSIGPIDKVFDDVDAATDFCQDLQNPNNDSVMLLKNWMEKGYTPIGEPQTGNRSTKN